MDNRTQRRGNNMLRVQSRAGSRRPPQRLARPLSTQHPTDGRSAPPPAFEHDRPAGSATSACGKSLRLHIDAFVCAETALRLNMLRTANGLKSLASSLASAPATHCRDAELRLSSPRRSGSRPYRPGRRPRVLRGKFGVPAQVGASSEPRSPRVSRLGKSALGGFAAPHKLTINGRNNP